MAVSRPRHRGAGASRARRAGARRVRPAPRFRACALLFASLALAAPSRASSEGTDVLGASVSVAHERDGLRDVPFETTALAGFDARDSKVTSVPTTIGGRIDWLGGFSVAFPGVVSDTGQSWNDFGGWSTLVGDARGERLWTLTDNYAYLLRVDVDIDSETGSLTNVRSIRNATDFAILVPANRSRLENTREATTRKGDEAFGDNDGAVKVARRVDVESIVSIPTRQSGSREDTSEVNDTSSNNPGDSGSDGDYVANGGLLADFAVGVEDSWELPANDVIRFKHGRRDAWTDVPGADDALNACDANLGPEALVWLPKQGTEPATLVTFCETPTNINNATGRGDAVRGFAFPLRDDDDDASNDVIDRDVTSEPKVLTFDLVKVDDDCGLSDAAVTPDGDFVLLLYHCYSYPPGKELVFGTGTHSTQIRVARTAELRGTVPSVKARLLARWSGAEGCPLTNMEGIHAVVSGEGRDIDLVLVSDNNLQPDDPTQIVRLRLVGGADVPDDVADAAETETAREARRIYARDRSVSGDGISADPIESVDASSADAIAATQSALGDAEPRRGDETNALWSFFPFSFFTGDADYDDELNASRRNETTSRIGTATEEASEDDAFYFPPDVETGIDFVDHAIESDAAFVKNLRTSDENAYEQIERERGTILNQLRAMSLLTIAATLTTSAVVCIAALAAASLARKARAGGTLEELRPLGVTGGVAYPKPYGYSEEYGYDAV